MRNNNVEVIGVIGKGGSAKVLCICRLCGESFTMWRSHYYRGSTACKCAVHDKRLYSIYTNMKTRCYNRNVINYCNYGGRGISVCDEWLNDYNAFEKWAKHNGYSAELSLDRKDVNGNYTPDNCRWIKPEEQAQNKRCTIHYNGVCLKKYCEDHGINYKRVHSHMRRHPELSVADVMSRY